MRRFLISIAGFLEDAKGLIGIMPVFLGMILLLSSRKLTQLLVGTDEETFVGPLIVAFSFFLMGTQGVIFALYKEYPVYNKIVQGKTAVVFGAIMAILGYFVTLFAIFEVIMHP